MKYEVSEADLKLIQGLLDVALRAGGLQNKPAVDRLIVLFASPIPETTSKNENPCYHQFDWKKNPAVCTLCGHVDKKIDYPEPGAVFYKKEKTNGNSKTPPVL